MGAFFMSQQLINNQNRHQCEQHMISLTQSRVLAVGGVYWYESVLNDRSRRVAEKCGLNL